MMWIKAPRITANRGPYSKLQGLPEPLGVPRCPPPVPVNHMQSPVPPDTFSHIFFHTSVSSQMQKILLASPFLTIAPSPTQTLSLASQIEASCGHSQEPPVPGPRHTEAFQPTGPTCSCSPDSWACHRSPSPAPAQSPACLPGQLLCRPQASQLSSTAPTTIHSHLFLCLLALPVSLHQGGSFPGAGTLAVMFFALSPGPVTESSKPQLLSDTLLEYMGGKG